MRISIVAFAGLLLGACASSSSPYQETSTVAAECSKGNYDWLLGSDARQLPTDQLPENRRVLDHTMSYTQDYIEGRLNVIYDKSSNEVVRVFCG